MSIVHVGKGLNVRTVVLNGRKVERISAYLVAGDFDDVPAALIENEEKAFIGSYLLGMGFTFDNAAAAKGEAEPIEEMKRLIARDPHNAERIKPYIGGEEINNSPSCAHHRYAIDFEDFPLRRDPAATHPWNELREDTKRAKLRSGIVSADYPWAVAEDWPDLIEIVERRVKGKRASHSTAHWWHYERRRGELSRAMSLLQHVLALSRVSPQLCIGRITSYLIPAESVVVFALPNFSPFAVLQSRVHEIWARFFSSSMKDDLRYAPSDCFETFPFPPDYETDPASEAAARTYHDHRAALMIAANEGMTKTYNRFHKAEERGEPIRILRELHDEMDRAVLRAYGWHDLADKLRRNFSPRKPRTTTPIRVAISGPRRRATGFSRFYSPSTPSATPRKSPSASPLANPRKVPRTRMTRRRRTSNSNDASILGGRSFHQLANGLSYLGEAPRDSSQLIVPEQVWTMYKSANRFMQRPVSDRHDANARPNRKPRVQRIKFKRCTKHGRSKCKICKSWVTVKERITLY